MSLSFLFTVSSCWQEKNRIYITTTKFLIFMITTFIQFYVSVFNVSFNLKARIAATAKNTPANNMAYIALPSNKYL